MTRGWIFVAGVLLAGCSSGTSGAPATVMRTVTHTATVTAEPSVVSSDPVVPSDTPEPAMLAVRDFRIKLKIKAKQCFGSAGCNITFRVDPTYVGAADLSSGSWSVTYVVRGGDSGPQVNSFTIEDGRASYDSEETISTKPNPHLTVRVTSVDTN